MPFHRNKSLNVTTNISLSYSETFSYLCGRLKDPESSTRHPDRRDLHKQEYGWFLTQPIITMDTSVSWPSPSQLRQNLVQKHAF